MNLNSFNNFMKCGGTTIAPAEVRGAYRVERCLGNETMEVPEGSVGACFSPVVGIDFAG